MRKRWLLLVVIIMQASLGRAQVDPLYGQYLLNQSMINPAYSGIHNVLNATLISRAQWTGIEGAPITNNLGVSSSFWKDKLGVGLMAINDRLGVNNNTEVNLSANYRIVFPNSKLSFGMQVSQVNYRYDYSRLNTEVVDMVLTQRYENFSRANVGAGVFYMAENYYVGISVPRFLRVDVQDGVSKSTRYKRHLYVSAGYVFRNVEAVKIKPSLLVRMVDNTKLSVDLSGQVLLAEVLWTGITIRNFNTLGLTSQLEIKNKYRVGYLFEMPTSKLAANNFGTHEIMLSIDLDFLGRQAALRRYF